MPDLTLLLDLPPEVARERLDVARTRYDRLEAEAAAFHDRVRAAYLEIAESDPARIAVVDATLPVDEIAAEVRKLVERLL